MIFQNLYPSEKDKTPEWAQTCVRNISYYGQTNVYFNLERWKTFKNYDIMRGVYDMTPLNYLTNPSSGYALPARWEHYDFINVKFEKIIGDYLSQPLSYYAHITNREGTERKVDLAVRVATERVTAQHRALIKEHTGIDLSDPMVANMSQEEQAKALNMSAKDMIELFTENALDYLINRYNIDEEYIKCLRDICICNKAFTRTRIVNGDPISKRVDPRTAIWDCDINETTINTANWFAEERFLTLSQILQEGRSRYTKEEIAAMKLMTDEYVTSLIKTDPTYEGFYKVSPNGGIRIRVINAVWCSSKLKEFKVSPNPYDPKNPYLQEITDEYREKYTRNYNKLKRDGLIKQYEADDWWEGEMIGYSTFACLGRMPNQPRQQSWGYTKSRSPYKGVIKDPIDGITMSLVDRLEQFQIMWDEVWYNIDFLLGRTNGKVLQYDVAQKPDTLTNAQVMSLAKNHGFVFVDSRKEGVRSNAFNQFSNADMSNTSDIVTLLNVAASIEKMADSIVGLNRGWQGDTKASDTLGNTQNNVMQANSVMRPLYKCHSTLVEQSLNGMADLFKYANWEENQRMSYILDDGSVKSFVIPENFRLDDLGIKLKVGYEEKEKMDKIGMMVNQALASGAIDFEHALDIFDLDTAAEAKATFKKGLEIMQQNRVAQQNAEMQAEHEKTVAEAQKGANAIKVAEINAQATITSTNIKEQAQNDRNVFDKNVEKELTFSKHKNELDKMAFEALNEELPTPKKLETVAE